MKPIIATLTLLLISCDFSSPIEIETGFKNVNGTSLYYEVIGNGEPIIIVHGGPGLNHTYLQEGLSTLANDYQLIFYDQRVCGQSTKEVDTTAITMKNFVEDIEALRKAFKIEKINLMAHSWGGLLAMHYAIRYPDHLKSLMLINSVGANNEIDAKANEILSQRFTGEDIEKQNQIYQSEAFKNREIKSIESLMKIGFKHQFYNPSYVDSLSLSLNEDYMQTSKLLRYLGNDLSTYNLEEALKAVKVPTLLVYGTHDPLTAFAGKQLNGLIPTSRFEKLEKSGHFPFIEQSDQFKRLIIEFLK
ncbi:proline iminopeptidase-family hydrolase [Ekhidna sp.]|uniref:proline iminopeptidase-family hydrolase n=1 Tax=Ekhidna sp. TaxID=2608089 RepID=UPI003B5B1F20